MNRLVVERSLSKQYILLKNKINRNKKLINLIKLVVVFIIFLFSVAVYWYFVNVGSTKWYFLRKEMSKLERLKLQEDIVKIEILKKQQRVLDQIDISNVWKNTVKVINLKWNNKL